MRLLFLLSFLLYTCTVSAIVDGDDARICPQGGPKPPACPDTNRWDNINCRWICETPEICINGQTRQQDCNTCGCKDGVWVCTQKGCIGTGIPIITLPTGTPKTCTSNEGFPVPAGSSYREKCNTCTCGDDGQSSDCTRASCPAKCYDDNGKSYEARDTRTAKDGCNQCTCGENGQWGCTRMACPKTCTSNEGFPVPAGASYREKCNTCTCGPNGERLCTRALCFAKCYDDNGTAYQDGETRTAKDGGCCTCGQDGTWGCTKTDCSKPPTTRPPTTRPPIATTRPPVIRGCVSNEGFPVAIGESYKDQCNTCTCEANGSGMCTLKFCSGTCFDDNGKSYKAGEQRTAKDGCNKCTCGENGQWGCTRMACQTCTSNEGFPVPAGSSYREKCNTCTCGQDGQSSGCTRAFCPAKCYDDNGKAYEAAEQRTAKDGGCCTCGQNGQWGCTRMACPKCFSNEGAPVPVGSTFRHECNTCTCGANGETTKCTEMFCDKKYKCYDDNGKGYTVGATRKDRDGCNTCSCSSGGNWQCTLMFCLPTGAPTLPVCPKTCTMSCIGGTTCEIRNCQQTCVPKKICPDVCAAVRCANGPCIVDRDCRASCATTPGSVVLTATFNITWTRKQNGSEIASTMRNIANNAGVTKNFLINIADIKKITGSNNKWTVKVAFKGTVTERQAAYDKFMTKLSEAGLGASGVTISGVIMGGGGLSRDGGATTSGIGMGGGGFSRDGGAIGGANPMLLVSEEEEVDTAIETMAMQSCENGEEISAEQQCPAEEIIVPLAETESSSSSSTRSLVPIIGAAVGGAVMLTLIIATLIVIRRHRRANSVKAMNHVQREGQMTPNPAVTMV